MSSVYYWQTPADIRVLQLMKIFLPAHIWYCCLCEESCFLGLSLIWMAPPRHTHAHTHTPLQKSFKLLVLYIREIKILKKVCTVTCLNSHDVGLCIFRFITFNSCFVCLKFQQMVVCFKTLWARLCVCEQVTAAAWEEPQLLQSSLRIKQVLHAAWHVTHSSTTAASLTLLTQRIHARILRAK